MKLTSKYLVKGLNKEIITKLDLFKGDNDYRFKTHAYRVNKKSKISCEIYMPNMKLENTND